MKVSETTEICIILYSGNALPIWNASIREKADWHSIYSYWRNSGIKKLLEFHKSHAKISTITGVHPSSRFGELKIKNNKIVKFHEKPQVSEGLIKGGFFVFGRKFLKYLWDADHCALEKEPLERLTKDRQLMIYTHKGFWQCVDTYRELEFLNKLWYSENPPWKIW